MAFSDPAFVSWPHQPLVRFLLLFSGGLLWACETDCYFPPSGILLICLLFLGLLFSMRNRRKSSQSFRLMRGGLISLLIFLTGLFSGIVRAPDTDPTYWKPEFKQPAICIVEVLPEPVHKTGNYRFNCSMLARFEGNSFYARRCDLRCTLPDSCGLVPQTGDRLLLNSMFQPPQDARLPGLFSMKSWLLSQGIVAEVRPESALLINPGNPSAELRRFMIRIRKGLIAGLSENGLSGNELAVGSALVLGERSEIDREVLVDYTSSGIVHILAVSGLHVGLIYAGLLLLIGRIKPLRNSVGGMIVCLAVLWGYALITGLSASVLRATVMYSFIAFAKLKKSPVSPFNALAASAFILLLADPWMYRNAGFQLSFAAVWGILLFAKPVERLAALYKAKWFKYLALSAGVSCSAQLSTLPLTLKMFGTFPVYFLLTNLICIPVSTLLTYAGIAAVLLSGLPFAGSFLVYVFGKGIAFLNGIAAVMADLPGAVSTNLYLSTPEMIFGMLIVFQLALIYRQRTAGKIWCLCAVLLILSLQTLYEAIDSSDKNVLLLFSRKQKLHGAYIFSGKAVFFHTDVDVAENKKADAELISSIRFSYGIDRAEYEVLINQGANSLVAAADIAETSFRCLSAIPTVPSEESEVRRGIVLIVDTDVMPSGNRFGTLRISHVLILPGLKYRTHQWWKRFAVEKSIGSSMISSKVATKLEL